MTPGTRTSAGILTVDVEDFYHAEAFSDVLRRSDWATLQKRVVENTTRLLRLFEARGTRATFFVLGIVAEEFPGLVRRIAEGGHEIASHGYDHRMATRQSPAEFRSDVRRSKQILESISGGAVAGYRAPTFSIVEATSWAHGVLREEGFEYSSSVFPIRHDRYGWPGFGTAPRRVGDEAGNGLWEIPLPVERVGGLGIPFGGGGYLRLYPFAATRALVRRKLSRGEPVVVYVHPWETDEEHPRVRLPFVRRARHYLGIGRMARRVAELVETFRFVTMAEFVRALEGECRCPGT